MRIAGHSSVTVSQQYVHSSPESLETAFERWEAVNRSKRSDVSVAGTKTATVTNRQATRKAPKRQAVNKMGA
jgi:hypothetical protein